MKATIESTNVLVSIDGAPARVWTGFTEHGIPIQLAIARVAVQVESDQREFERELEAVNDAPAPDVVAFPLRLIL